MRKIGLSRFISQRRLLSNEAGVVIIWTAAVAMGVMLLIALAISVLQITNAQEQTAQYAEYYAEAALRRYHELRDSQAIDPFAAGYNCVTDGNEAGRRIAAMQYGKDVADNTTNRDYFMSMAPPQVVTQSFGYWCVAQDAANGCPIVDNIDFAYAGCDANAVMIDVRGTIGTGTMAKLFNSVASINNRASVQVVYDESLMKRGMYPFLVKRVHQKAGNSFFP